MRHAALLLAAISAATATVPAESPPGNVRVLLQFIELPHPALTALMAGADTSGAALHANAMALVKTGEAKVLESAVVTTRDGQKASVESVREVIHPTEYQPPSMGGTEPTTTQSPGIFTRFLSIPYLFSWDTRNAGITIEVEPSLSKDRRMVELRITSEIVALSDLVTWIKSVDRWGDNSIRMPTFDTLRTNTTVTLAPGVFEMAAVLSPTPAAPAPAVLRKVLVFVRADLLP